MQIALAILMLPQLEPWGAVRFAFRGEGVCGLQEGDGVFRHDWGRVLNRLYPSQLIDFDIFSIALISTLGDS